jgi:hypothetical protein
MDDAPRLKPWGAWEFCLLDAEGIRLVFVQWALGRRVLPAGEPQPSGDALGFRKP